jgi:hypothetical protein
MFLAQKIEERILKKLAFIAHDMLRDGRLVTLSHGVVPHVCKGPRGAQNPVGLSQPCRRDCLLSASASAAVCRQA